ncbi:hypothetical protein C815_01696 [Firmicutes bacterium M10-2]|nr:hypothetical protein C815_01696 [Firmicutes bacterium M10-2]
MTQFIVLKDKISDQKIYEGEGTISFEGKEKKKIAFHDKQASYIYKLYKDHCEIISESEMKVCLSLYPCQKGAGTIETPFGVIDVTTQTQKYEISEYLIELAYTLSLQGDEQLFHFGLELIEKE